MHPTANDASENSAVVAGCWHVLEVWRGRGGVLARPGGVARSWRGAGASWSAGAVVERCWHVLEVWRGRGEVLARPGGVARSWRDAVKVWRGRTTYP
jgi:hypothetical protein